MRKQEFLDTLRRALTGDVPPGVVEEHIRYYDRYITEEVGKGRTEEEVIGEIGDPRLIARTIEDTTDGAGGTVCESGRDYGYDRNQTREEELYGDTSPFHIIRLDKWYWKLLLALIVFGIIYLVIMIVGGIFALLAPLVLPLLVIWLIITIFRGSRR